MSSLYNTESRIIFERIVQMRLESFHISTNLKSFRRPALHGVPVISPIRTRQQITGQQTASETLLLLYGCFLVSPEDRAFRHDIPVLTNQCFHMVQNSKRENNVDRKSNLNCLCVYIYTYEYICNGKKEVWKFWKRSTRSNPPDRSFAT